LKGYHLSGLMQITCWQTWCCSLQPGTTLDDSSSRCTAGGSVVVEGARWMAQHGWLLTPALADRPSSAPTCNKKNSAPCASSCYRRQRLRTATACQAASGISSAVAVDTSTVLADRHAAGVLLLF
jgi:hypothetical protein